MSRRGPRPRSALPGAPGAAVLATALILVLSAGVLAGCSMLSGPSPPTRYSLVSVAGAPVPAAFDSFRDTEGNIRTLEAVEARLALFPDGSYRRDWTVRRKLNGEVVESWPAILEGRVERVGQTLILRNQSPGGYEERVIYEVLEGGRRLAGIHSNGRVWRWVREDASQ